jgi:hypothetical protein
MTRTIRFLCLATALSCVSATAARAGGSPNEPILDKAIQQTAVTPVAPPVAEAPPAPEPAPAPVIAAKPKGFVFEPSVTVREMYDSNIFATDVGRKSDFITSVIPALHFGLINSPHKADFEGEFEVSRNRHHDEENQNNYKARFAGFLQALSSLKLPFDIGFKRQHEDRIDDLTQQLPVKPIHFTDFKGMGGFEYKPGAVGFAMNGTYEEMKYGDGEDEFGAPVIRRDADHHDWGGEAALSFDTGAGSTLALIGRYGKRDYERRNFTGTGFNGQDRDSRTWAALAGLKNVFHGLMSDIKLGLGDRHYKDNTIDDVRTMIGDANIHYDLTDAAGLTLTASRFIHEDDEVVNPIVRTQAGLMLDQKLFNRKVDVGVGAERQFWNFQDSSRDDKVWKITALADYYLTKHFSVGAEYNYLTRASDAPGLDLVDNRVMVNVKGKL